MRKLSELLFKKKVSNQTPSEQTPIQQVETKPTGGDVLEDYHAHGYLGNMYLSLGDLAEAELEYGRAYALCPSDEVRTKLADVRKRRAAQRRSAQQPASATRAA
jgi:hypothetical protein